jgi:pyruvate,water dikinase
VPDYLDAPAPWREKLATRAAQRDRLRVLVPPFVFSGTVPPIDTWARRDQATEDVIAGTALQGIGACPGVARGRARVVLDPFDPKGLGPGDVLIAPLTDPSWTPLFLSAEAVVVDVGALMSHAVIVSRELGIPCVVSVTGATTTIPDGAEIEVDGTTGIVRVL